jgi:hypothetical protein
MMNESIHEMKGKIHIYSLDAGLKSPVTCYVLFVLMMILFSGCRPEHNEPVVIQTGKIIFRFEHHVNGSPLIKDTMTYTNAAGNHYLVTEVQYFISDVTLHRHDGEDYVIHAWKDIWYVDDDIPSTMLWEVFDDIPNGVYDSVSFTFGIPAAKNISLMYVNPPERDMFWPDVLGGGYHYLKLNGKWLNDTMTQNRPFEFHLGIGQIYAHDSIYVPDIIGFVHNDFEVLLPSSSFTMKADTVIVPIIMNIENWFQHPYVFDFALYPDNIMQCQEAMHIACMNGKEDVFTTGEIEEKAGE